ncbi:sucrose-specific PTS transporter subunit IIBC [Ruminococcus sp. OA3]|uniref:sucrose-specific PTS transporter subunit IIBC n=1 Tax=Ruminococcus sp. OA3 TaxID=2914164 RepID=UPI001F0551D1|nr:sucrose-specific PTS transporter subunit IIBC [Ruminococcus sp. OA3]MCH1981399.1 sucrose-specific PTS transporter subunit IIBC [Ruminococcus sp. OA3]
MDYGKVAKAVYEYIGGRENIVSAAHCATRLRLVIGDNKKCSKEALENIDGVKGVFEAAGQLQIIFGTGVVNKVYDEFIKIAGITEASKEDVKKAAAKKQNVFKRAIRTLGDIFVPIIPAIVASGLLMGLLEGLANVWPAMTGSGTYTIIHLFSNAAFVFLPVLIAVSAAKTFGGNLFLGAVIGMIMIHPDLLNAWSVAGMEAADIPSASAWFGLYDINLVGYQGHVIPVVIAVWLMCVIEKKLHKIVPEMIDLFVTPLVTVLVTGYLTLTVIGPVFSALENYVLAGAQALIAVPFGIGGALIGAAYAPTVVAGVHHMYNALEAGLLSSIGLNTWMPIATAANVAQGAAALALALKTRNKKTKAIALPASLSAFLGITEPAIFGVNIRYMRPFIAGCIGGACGGLTAGLFGVGATAYGITGIFGFLITTNYTLQYALVILVASAVAFIISWLLYKEPKENVETAKAQRTEASETEVPKSIEINKHTVYSPIQGTAILLAEVPDDTFAAEILGKGMAIVPESGEVVAPVNGTISTIFDTRHAVGITADDGMEILIHVGINTVELKGQYFTAHVEEGDPVKAGQPLLTVDLEGIQAAGYNLTTPVIVTNSDDYAEVLMTASGKVDVLDQILEVRS